MLEDIEILFFADESKFSLNNGDFEDSIYYFCVAVKKNYVSIITDKFNEILLKHRVQTEVYHSTKIFRERKSRKRLMTDITDMIIDNKLDCYIVKYKHNLLFNITKNYFSHLNDNDIINFDNPEFQAVFYFVSLLNVYLKEKVQIQDKTGYMFFDRNVYGKNDIEAFNFPYENFVVTGMTFCEKSKIKLLSLPDFIGYIFRKSKNSFNKSESGSKEIETSTLVINAYTSLLKIKNTNLFHFIEIDNDTLEKSIKLYLNK